MRTVNPMKMCPESRLVYMFIVFGTDTPISGLHKCQCSHGILIYLLIHSNICWILVYYIFDNLPCECLVN